MGWAVTIKIYLYAHSTPKVHERWENKYILNQPHV